MIFKESRLDDIVVFLKIKHFWQKNLRGLKFKYFNTGNHTFMVFFGKGNEKKIYRIVY